MERLLRTDWSAALRSADAAVRAKEKQAAPGLDRRREPPPQEWRSRARPAERISRRVPFSPWRADSTRKRGSRSRRATDGRILIVDSRQSAVVSRQSSV